MLGALHLLCLASFITAIQCAAVSCGGSKLPPALVQQILDQHNTYRSTLANGNQPKKGGGFAPSGKNMYKITWNCDLESISQRYAETCSLRPGVTNDGENIYLDFGSTDTSMGTTIPKASDNWWSQYMFSGPVNNSDNILTQDVYNHGFINWFQMAWGATTQIGCGFGCCSFEGQPTAFIVCRYRTRGNVIDQPIYELGSPCSKNHDCTTYPNSKCGQDGLCHL